MNYYFFKTMYGCFFIMTFLLFILPSISFAEAKNPFYIEVIAPKLEVGSQDTIDVIFVVPPDHHLYRDMMLVNVASIERQNSKGIKRNTKAGNNELHIEPISFEDGTFIQDPANPMDLRELYKTTTKARLPITGLSSGEYSVHMNIRYQGCKKTLCYMPQYEDHVIDVVVTEKSKTNTLETGK